jgi:hypothetical protein
MHSKSNHESNRTMPNWVPGLAFRMSVMVSDLLGYADTAMMLDL